MKFQRIGCLILSACAWALIQVGPIEAARRPAPPAPKQLRVVSQPTPMPQPILPRRPAPPPRPAAKPAPRVQAPATAAKALERLLAGWQQTGSMVKSAQLMGPQVARRVERMFAAVGPVSKPVLVAALQVSRSHGPLFEKMMAKWRLADSDTQSSPSASAVAGLTSTEASQFLQLLEAKLAENGEAEDTRQQLSALASGQNVAPVLFLGLEHSSNAGAETVANAPAMAPLFAQVKPADVLALVSEHADLREALLEALEWSKKEPEKAEPVIKQARDALVNVIKMDGLANGSQEAVQIQQIAKLLTSQIQ